MTRDKAFKRMVRDRMAETGEAYTTARAHLVTRRPAPPVAITNGDSVAGTLRAAGLATAVIPWRDVLHEGPVPDLQPAALRKVRAAFAAARYGLSEAEVARSLKARDEALRRHASAPLTLWFEADLYDQLQLVQVLARLRAARRGDAELTLVSIGEHPDRARFGGLGELTGEQLRALLPAARPLTATSLDLATEAWRAFTAPDPRGLEPLRGTISVELRYLGDALGRLLGDYPSATDGLSLTQRRLLLAVERGRTTLAEILREHWQTEPRPFLGDLGLRAELDDLASQPNAALTLSGGRWSLTDFGRRLLDGAADWVAEHGVDRWIGGVHLDGRDVPWRYDDRRERLVTAS